MSPSCTETLAGGISVGIPAKGERRWDVSLEVLVKGVTSVGGWRWVDGHAARVDLQRQNTWRCQDIGSSRAR